MSLAEDPPDKSQPAQDAIAMVAVQQGKVLVTGANGFIAMWVVKHLLDQGYSVRGTVRSERKAKHVREVFSKYGDKFEVVIVEDITKVCFCVKQGSCNTPRLLMCDFASAARGIRCLRDRRGCN